MGETLSYDESEARQEAAIYRTPTAADRRATVRELLSLERGESVCSIGCGPGFEPAELADAVGPSGRVLDVDRSDAMLGLAARRCADRPEASLAAGDAADLPVAEDAVDAAVAVQVYEYLDDVAPAVAELERVLRPGGRAVVCDADFETLVWRSPNPERMDRVLAAFDDHCPHPRLGSRLGPILRDAGLTVDRVVPNAMCTTRFADGTFPYHLAAFVADYAADHDDVGPETADAWAADLREQAAQDASFFGFTQYCYLVRNTPKPGSTNRRQ